MIDNSTGEEDDFAGEEEKVLTVAPRSAKELHKETLWGAQGLAGDLHRNSLGSCTNMVTRLLMETSSHFFWFLWKNGDTFF